MKLPFKRGKNEDGDPDEKEELKKPEPKKRGRKSKSEKEKEEKEKQKKPWGRYERYLVLFFLISTIAASGVLALASRSWKVPNAPRLKIPTHTFEETFVLGGSRDTVDTSLATEIADITRKLSGVYGYKAINLHNGKTSGLFENETFQAASLVKLPVMSMMFEQAERRRLNLDAKHSLTEEEKVGGSGSLFYEPAGTVVTYRELIELMGKQSDNTAFNIAINTLGKEKVEEYIQGIGMRDTILAKNETTSNDIAKFFEKLWEGRLVDDDHKSELISYLTDTIYENHLPAKLPEDTRVAHKYGRELHVVNDAGIVFTSSPYVVVILSKGIVDAEADEIIPEISRTIFNSFN